MEPLIQLARATPLSLPMQDQHQPLHCNALYCTAPFFTPTFCLARHCSTCSYLQRRNLQDRPSGVQPRQGWAWNCTVIHSSQPGILHSGELCYITNQTNTDVLLWMLWYIPAVHGIAFYTKLHFGQLCCIVFWSSTAFLLWGGLNLNPPTALCLFPLGSDKIYCISFQPQMKHLRVQGQSAGSSLLKWCRR